MQTYVTLLKQLPNESFGAYAIELSDLIDRHIAEPSQALKALDDLSTKLRALSAENDLLTDDRYIERSFVLDSLIEMIIAFRQAANLL